MGLWMLTMPSELQWGHAVIGVDTGPIEVQSDEAWRLQWGHAVIGVDTRSFCLTLS